MDALPHSQTFLRKRKMMLVLPLLVLPFTTMIFWALGGGKLAAATVQKTTGNKGLNLDLPNAHLKPDNGMDKMSYYELAEADSDKLKMRLRSDPYFKLKNNLLADRTIDSTEGEPVPEKQVYDKLRQIKTVMESASSAAKVSAATTGLPDDNIKSERLNKMMQAMKQPGTGPDSEMVQINAMLEKVMDIQHPERLNEKYKQAAITQKTPALMVTIADTVNNGFFGFADSDAGSLDYQAIEAVVHETQTLVNGAIVKLRLLTGVSVNGLLVPKDNFVYGLVSLTGERLAVTINSIRCGHALLPVAMTVHDLDGMEGIYIPGAISRDVAKQSTDNALQSIALSSLDPSIGAQAASAGIETAKTLISKKVKLVRVTVKAGYHVLLKDGSSK